MICRGRCCNPVVFHQLIIIWHDFFWSKWSFSLYWSLNFFLKCLSARLSSLVVSPFKYFIYSKYASPTVFHNFKRWHTLRISVSSRRTIFTTKRLSSLFELPLTWVLPRPHIFHSSLQLCPPPSPFLIPSFFPFPFSFNTIHFLPRARGGGGNFILPCVSLKIQCNKTSQSTMERKSSFPRK